MGTDEPQLFHTKSEAQRLLQVLAGERKFLQAVEEKRSREQKKLSVEEVKALLRARDIMREWVLHVKDVKDHSCHDNLPDSTLYAEWLSIEIDCRWFGVDTN